MVDAINVLGQQLRNTGSALTSWVELGLVYDEAGAGEVIRTVPEDLVWPHDDEVKRSARAWSPACKAAAMVFARPVIDSLFEGDDYERARRDAHLFGVNYYENASVFPKHRDFNNSDLSTAVILSLSGVRRLKADDITYRLKPFSILLLDGAINPEHLAVCEEGPSVSVVVDVPGLLR